MTRATTRKRQNGTNKNNKDSCDVLRKKQQEGLIGTTSKGSPGIMVSSQSGTASSIDSLVDDENSYIIELQRKVESMDRQLQSSLVTSTIKDVMARERRTHMRN